MNEQTSWDILDAYVKEHGIASNQIDSFNDFVQFGMQEIVDQESTITEGTYTVKFGQISLAPPQVIEEDRTMHSSFPNDARMRDLNYDSAIHLDITESFEIDGKMEKRVHLREVIGRLPVMLRSDICNLSKLSKTEQIKKGECPNDPGGYFVIKGNERVLVGQMRAVYNQVFVIAQKPESKYKYIAQTRSMSGETGHSVLVQAMIGLDDRTISFSIPYIKEKLPIGVVFKALGFVDEDEIVGLIGLDHPSAKKYMRFILRDSFFCQTKEDALAHIAQFAMHIISDDRKESYSWQVIETELLPHLGITGTVKEQACYLANIVRKLLATVLGIRVPVLENGEKDPLGINEDDRDSYQNKRVEIAGQLLYELFRNLFKKFSQYIKAQLEKKKQLPDIIAIISRNKNITKGLHQCMATGNWNVQKNATYVRTGVCQILDRMTYAAMISHLRRVIIPTGKEGKNTAIRQLHGSSIFFIDPSECFDPATPILLWNGIVKRADKIKVGDVLIDDQGNPSRVKKTCSGYKNMYEIQHEKKSFQNYTVTDNHILTLKSNKHKQLLQVKGQFQVIYLDKETVSYRYRKFPLKEDAEKYLKTIPDDSTVDMTIEKYLGMSEYLQKTFRTFKCPQINWPEKEVEIDPYILGMWLGDGLSSGYGFASADPELVDVWKEWAEENGGVVEHGERYRYFVRPKVKAKFTGDTQNPLRLALDKYGLVGNKHIPSEYIVNSRRVRLQVLAGLVDTDGSVRDNGHEIRISQGPKNTKIVNDALFLARSLGFSCTVSTGKSSWTLRGEKKHSTYTELRITGKNICEIPTKLERKRLIPPNDHMHAKRSDSFMQSNFKLVKKEYSPFVGWQLEGNGRFLLGDCTVTHNTPEGAKVGTVLNLAFTAKITRRIPTVIVRQVLEKIESIISVEDMEISEMTDNTPIFLNGIVVGFTSDPDDTVDEIRNYRRKGVLDGEVSVSYDIIDNEIKVFCDEGRFCRPLLTLTDNDFNIRPPKDGKTYRWSSLVKKDYIRYVDASEIEGSVIAMYPKMLSQQRSDYCEIHPCLMLGVVAGVIPFPDHTQSPRVCYQSSMGKQALGMPMLSYNVRADTLLHVLHYPQRSLVSTKIADLLNVHEMPSGINAVVAIACYSGFNQEDSIMLNLSSVQRGLFCLTSYHTIDASEKKRDTYSYEEICVPPQTTDKIKPGEPGYFRRKNANYSLLDENGIIKHRIPKPGASKGTGSSVYVKKGDVIVGKVVVTGNKGGEETKVDASVVIQQGEEGYIDKVNVMLTPNGYKLVKIVIRVNREPTIGDKLASAMAQKGTIGMLYRHEDMPFSSTGVVPDLIISPSCIPSRSGWRV